MAISMQEEDRIAKQRADEVFDALSDFEKLSLHRDGTAFTTYEDLGDLVCGWLQHAARVWAHARDAEMERKR